ncbi:hypothetical protein ES708_05772 [subsurface metagenome]
MKSFEPTEEPARTTTISFCEVASSKIFFKSTGMSLTISYTFAFPPHSEIKPLIILELYSIILPGLISSLSGINSSPVGITATLGFLRARSWFTPPANKAPISTGRIL